MIEKKYRACCPCTNINFLFTTSLPSTEWRVRTCDCSFCSNRTGHIHCADPNGEVSFEFQNSAKVRWHRHGTNTAIFIECSSCRAYLGAISLVGESRIAVLNIQYLVHRVRLAKSYIVPWHSENIEERLARRLKTWTPVVDWISDPRFLLPDHMTLPKNV